MKIASPLRVPVAVSLLGARAPDIRGNLKLLASCRYLRIVIHVGTNDVRLQQSEISEDNIKEVCKLAQTMLIVIITSY